MEPEIITTSPKKLIGKYVYMNFANNLTGKLWAGFMPHKKEIQNSLSTDLISMQVHKEPFKPDQFDPHQTFQKWATVEVTDHSNIPNGMEAFTIPEGLYAVFHYKGSSTDPSIFQYIFGAWLPNSPYQLDHRPHFEVLGEKYKNNDPNSEEDIYIPVKLR